MRPQAVTVVAAVVVLALMLVGPCAAGNDLKQAGAAGLSKARTLYEEWRKSPCSERIGCYACAGHRLPQGRDVCVWNTELNLCIEEKQKNKVTQQDGFKARFGSACSITEPIQIDTGSAEQAPAKDPEDEYFEHLPHNPTARNYYAEEELPGMQLRGTEHGGLRVGDDAGVIEDLALAETTAGGQFIRNTAECGPVSPNDLFPSFMKTDFFHVRRAGALLDNSFEGDEVHFTDKETDKVRFELIKDTARGEVCDSVTQSQYQTEWYDDLEWLRAHNDPALVYDGPGGGGMAVFANDKTGGENYRARIRRTTYTNCGDDDKTASRFGPEPGTQYESAIMAMNVWNSNVCRVTKAPCPQNAMQILQDMIRSHSSLALETGTEDPRLTRTKISSEGADYYVLPTIGTTMDLNSITMDRPAPHRVEAGTPDAVLANRWVIEHAPLPGEKWGVTHIMFTVPIEITEQPDEFAMGAPTPDGSEKEFGLVYYNYPVWYEYPSGFLTISGPSAITEAQEFLSTFTNDAMFKGAMAQKLGESTGICSQCRDQGITENGVEYEPRACLVDQPDAVEDDRATALWKRKEAEYQGPGKFPVPKPTKLTVDCGVFQRRDSDGRAESDFLLCTTHADGRHDCVGGPEAMKCGSEFPPVVRECRCPGVQRVPFQAGPPVPPRRDRPSGANKGATWGADAAALLDKEEVDRDWPAEALPSDRAVAAQPDPEVANGSEEDGHVLSGDPEPEELFSMDGMDDDDKGGANQEQDEDPRRFYPRPPTEY